MKLILFNANVLRQNNPKNVRVKNRCGECKILNQKKNTELVCYSPWLVNDGQVMDVFEAYLFKNGLQIKCLHWLVKKLLR